MQVLRLARRLRQSALVETQRPSSRPAGRAKWRSALTSRAGSRPCRRGPRPVVRGHQRGPVQVALRRGRRPRDGLLSLRGRLPHVQPLQERLGQAVLVRSAGEVSLGCSAVPPSSGSCRSGSASGSPCAASRPPTTTSAQPILPRSRPSCTAPMPTPPRSSPSRRDALAWVEAAMVGVTVSPLLVIGFLAGATLAQMSPSRAIGAVGPFSASAWRRPSRRSCDRAAHHGVRARRCDRVLATLTGRGPVRISPDLNHQLHCDLADPAEPAPGEASQRGGVRARPRSAHSSTMGHISMPTPRPLTATRSPIL